MDQKDVKTVLWQSMVKAGVNGDSASKIIDKAFANGVLFVHDEITLAVPQEEAVALGDKLEEELDRIREQMDQLAYEFNHHRPPPIPQLSFPLHPIPLAPAMASWEDMKDRLLEMLAVPEHFINQELMCQSKECSDRVMDGKRYCLKCEWEHLVADNATQADHISQLEQLVTDTSAQVNDRDRIIREMAELLFDLAQHAPEIAKKATATAEAAKSLLPQPR